LSRVVVDRNSPYSAAGSNGAPVGLAVGKTSVVLVGMLGLSVLDLSFTGPCPFGQMPEWVVAKKIMAVDATNARLPAGVD
jgi:hypothetical protein